METVLNLIQLCLTYVTSVNEFQLIAFKCSRKSHIGTVRIYMSPVALSATSGKVEMHTLRTLVDVSLLFSFEANSTFVKCMFSRYECMFFL